MVRRVVVRDYAYPCDDERFLGLGPTRPRSNWCEGEPEPEDPPERAKSEAAGGWGLSLGGLGWGLLRKSEEPTTGGDDQDWVGTPDHDADSYWSDEDDADGEGENGDTTPDGLYRAAYAFEPEGVNEMAIDVGDLLDVRGRGGGGDGWVVAVRLDNDKEGLVPEGYLEFVDEDECPEGWAHLRKQRTDAEERERIRAREGQSEEDLLIETRVERG
jgi:hypothetical protein